MLSDEVLDSMQVLKFFHDKCLSEKSIGMMQVYRVDELAKAIETILNLIEKQSKEIEHQKEKRENQKLELAILNAKQIEFNKLKNTVNSYKGQFKRQQKELEELKGNKKFLEKQEIEYIRDRTEDEINFRWKDKIKAEIEESELLIDNSQGCMSDKDLYKEFGKIEFGKSLLEKE